MLGQQINNRMFKIRGAVSVGGPSGCSYRMIGEAGLVPGKAVFGSYYGSRRLPGSASDWTET
jgi:hypothetical protein